jgi:hypothetical protein
LETPIPTHFEKCLLVRHQTLELLTRIARHGNAETWAQTKHKIGLLCDELESAWTQARFNEIAIVYEKAKHLSQSVPGAG